MFKITRLAAAMTKIERKAVKLVGQGKIKLESASDSFKLLNATGTKKAPHSKNIFKRAYNWCKTFIGNFKNIKKGINEGIKLVKESWDEATMGKLTKKQLNKVKTDSISLAKAMIKHSKNEINDLLAAGKAAGTKAKGTANNAASAAK